MKLNKSKGNMYDFVTHTGNSIKGICPHDCSYCYMKDWGNQKPVRLDEKELSTAMESGNFIFIGSSCDMFAQEIPDSWIFKTLVYCAGYDNSYLFQSKDPKRLFEFQTYMPSASVVCTTIETNRLYPEIMKNSPMPEHRAKWMNKILLKKYVTVEPIMDFDVDELFELIVMCKPEQVNIGADSGGNKLPEPSVEKIMMLIEMLKGFTTIHKKNNLKRLIQADTISTRDLREIDDAKGIE